MSVIILPNVGGLSEEQVDGVQAFVAAGGSVIATGEVRSRPTMATAAPTSRWPICSACIAKRMARSVARMRRTANLEDA